MTYLRVTRDQRGYETTFLLHSSRPGEPARVLYWYRTAPGIRVGRPPLDEDAIRALEEQHPDIEFDWPQLIEEATLVVPDVDRRPERPRRKRPKEAAPSDTAATVETLAPTAPADEALAPAAPPPGVPVNPLLDQLVGREIATRLRARYAEVAGRIQKLDEFGERARWQARAEALNPDRWSSPESILEGVQHADRLFDELKHELP